MKRFLIIIYIIVINTILWSSETINERLDRSIEEFSKKNYELSLEIINSILEDDPKNETALMYKKTIEDVILADENREQSEQNTQSSDVVTVNNVATSNLTTSTETVKKSLNGDLLYLSTYIGHNSDNNLYIENRIKINLGLPVLQAKFRSKIIDYDIVNINFKNLPLEDVFNAENYNMDFSIGLRYQPFSEVTDSGGFFDFLIGASDLSEDGINAVPYIGFDTEFFPFTPFGDNIIFNNFWLGCSGSIFSSIDYDKFYLDVKAGIDYGPLKLGLFYNYNRLELGAPTIFGVILGVKI